MTEIRGLRDLAPGDPVQVSDGNGIWDGTVAKVGRTLLHVTYGFGRHPVAFRLDTGVINDDYGRCRVRTPEQAAEAKRRRDVQVRLREAGLTVRHEHRLATDTLVALAAVLDQHEGSEQ